MLSNRRSIFGRPGGAATAETQKLKQAIARSIPNRRMARSPMLCQQAAKKGNALGDVVIRSVAFDRQHAAPVGLLQILDTTLDVVGVHTAADRNFAASDPRLLATSGCRQLLTNVFDMRCDTYSRKRCKYSSGSLPEMNELPVSKFSRR